MSKDEGEAGPAPDEFSFRRAELADIERLLPLVAAFHVEEGVDSSAGDRRGALETLFEAPGIGEARLIERAGDAVGYIALAYGFSIEFNGRDCFLDELYVAPACRGLGLGRAAIRAARADLTGRGFKAMHLEVLPANPAVRLYEGEGFELRRGYHLMSLRFDEPS